jgi:hypothetical protein
VKVVYVHTDPSNAEKTEAVARHFAGADGRTEKGNPETAVALVAKPVEGEAPIEYEAVVSAGLAKVQEIVNGYKKQNVVAHVVGVNAAPSATVTAAAKAKTPRGAEQTDG